MPTTPTRALPYPSADLPADVPLDMQKLAEKTATELDAIDARHVRAVRRVMTAVNSFNSSSWSDFSNSSDAAAMSMSFVKNRADTRLIVTYYGSAETWGSDQTRWGFGLRINSTDYELARMFFNNSGGGARRGFSGVIEITGLPAGTYPVRPRVIRLAGGSGNFGLSFYTDDDFVSYSIEETP